MHRIKSTLCHVVGTLLLSACSSPSASIEAAQEMSSSQEDESTAADPTSTPDVETDDGSSRVQERGIRIDGRKLFVDGAPFEVRAVAWNPVNKGGTHPQGLDFTGNVERDAKMMRDAGFNAVRTYVPLEDTAVLDVLWKHGLRVLNSVYAYGGDAPSAVTARVQAVANHPSTLAWLVGNEWNYNGLYVGMSQADARSRLNEVMTLIRASDTRIPIVNVYGEVPPQEVIDSMPLTDIWGINAYRGISFGDLFTAYAARSPKPLLLGEYGADAWNSLINAEDTASQADATFALTAEIHAQWSGTGGVAIGGAVFEWNDEWWKDGAGSPSQHDIGGVAPGGGPHPDATFNEEWWGLVDIDRNPRPALAAATKGWGL